MIYGIDSKQVIGECLETAFGLKKYTKIVDAVGDNNFKATPDFRRLFNGYYRVRQKSTAWYDTYFTLLEHQKKSNRSIKYILTELYKVSGSVEPSFASKLIATANPSMPIWDQYVLNSLGLKKDWDNCRSHTPKDRINKAVDLYSKIKEMYVAFQNDPEGKSCLTALDDALPKYAKKITTTKKIDFILWSKR